MFGILGIIGLANYYKNTDSDSKDAKVYALIAALYILFVAWINALIKYNSIGIAVEHAIIDSIISFFVAWLYFNCVDKTAAYPWFQWITIILGSVIFFMLV